MLVDENLQPCILFCFPTQTLTANCTLLSVKMGGSGGNDVYRLDIREGTVVYLYGNSVLTSGHVVVNDGDLAALASAVEELVPALRS